MHWGPTAARSRWHSGATCLQTYVLPDPGRLDPAVRLVTHLGCFRGRKHDPNPGHQLVSRLRNADTGVAGSPDCGTNRSQPGHRSLIKIMLF